MQYRFVVNFGTLSTKYYYILCTLYSVSVSLYEIIKRIFFFLFMFIYQSKFKEGGNIYVGINSDNCNKKQQSFYRLIILHANQIYSDTWYLYYKYHVLAKEITDDLELWTYSVIFYMSNRSSPFLHRKLDKTSWTYST